jgi:hypothetical protein
LSGVLFFNVGSTQFDCAVLVLLTMQFAASHIFVILNKVRGHAAGGAVG